MPLYGRHQPHAIHGSWWRQETRSGVPGPLHYLAAFTWPGDRAGSPELIVSSRRIARSGHQVSKERRGVKSVFGGLPPLRRARRRPFFGSFFILFLVFEPCQKEETQQELAYLSLASLASRFTGLWPDLWEGGATHLSSNCDPDRPNTPLCSSPHVILDFLAKKKGSKTPNTIVRHSLSRKKRPSTPIFN